MVDLEDNSRLYDHYVDFGGPYSACPIRVNIDDTRGQLIGINQIAFNPAHDQTAEHFVLGARSRATIPDIVGEEDGFDIDIEEPPKEALNLALLKKRSAQIKQSLAELNNDAGHDRLEPFEIRLLRLVAAYTKYAPRLTSDGSSRDLTKMLAWAEQAGQAVCAEFWPKVDLKRSHFLLYIAIVILDVVFQEDPKETLQGEEIDQVRNVLDKMGIKRILREKINLEEIEGYHELSSPQKAYVELVRDSFVLVNDAKKILYPNLRRIEDETLKSEIKTILAWMLEAEAEWIKMIGFSQQFDQLIKGEINEIDMQVYAHLNLGINCNRKFTRDNLPSREEYLRLSQSNIVMRYLFLARFLQQWSMMNTHQRSQYDFDFTLREMNELGLHIEKAGTQDNHDVTALRELGECFVGSALFVDALHRKVITPEKMQAAMAVVRQNPEEAKQRLAQMNQAIFKGDYESRREEWSKDAITDLVDALYFGGSFRLADKYWKRQIAMIEDRFGRSPITHFVNLPDLIERQRTFRKQYEAANGLV